MSRRRDRIRVQLPIPNWDWWMVNAGLALMLLGVLTLAALPAWNRDYFHSRALALAAPLGAVVLFALGWILVGAGFRPGESAWQSAVRAAVAYILVGVLWFVGYLLVDTFGDRERILANLAHPAVLLTSLVLVLIWPLHVAFVLGLFGLGPQ